MKESPCQQRGNKVNVMMFTDHVLYFMPFYMIINVAILVGFAYMYHDEIIKDNKEVVKKHISIWTVILLSVVVDVIFTALMVYGPKSILFG